jgi:peptide chain release factor 3
VGELQFQVARHRLESELGCPVRMAPGPWVSARRILGPGAAVAGYGVDVVEDSRGRPLALFRSLAVLARALKDSPEGHLAPVGIDAGDPLPGWAA